MLADGQTVGNSEPRGGLICRDYRKRCGTGLADALIAATAEIYSLELVTLNTMHFPMLERVRVPYVRRQG